MDLNALTHEPFATDAGVAAVLTAFRDCTLPRTAWNHRAHLTVALSVARSSPSARALDAIRSEILRFNAAVGIQSTPDSGYHETLTVFYLHVVTLHATRYPAPASAADDANLLFAEWGDRDLPLQHYSRDRLFSREARARWLPPDLTPLPAV
jgi:hypothetical protein